MTARQFGWLLRGYVRWLLRRPCDVCGDRKRCWRWHVEFFNCPTCNTPVSEFDDRAAAVFAAMSKQPNRWERRGSFFLRGDTTSTNAHTVTLVWPEDVA